MAGAIRLSCKLSWQLTVCYSELNGSIRKVMNDESSMVKSLQDHDSLNLMNNDPFMQLSLIGLMNDESSMA